MVPYSGNPCKICCKVISVLPFSFACPVSSTLSKFAAFFSSSNPTPLQHSRGIQLTDLSMALALGYRCRISVETIPSGGFWLLVISMSISDPFPPGLVFDLASLYEPFVNLKVNQDQPFKVQLSLFNGGIWREIWASTLAPIQSLPQFTVAFWNRFGGNLNHEFDVDTWKVELHLTPTVSRHNSFPRNCN